MCRAMQRRHAMKKKMHTCNAYTDCTYVCFKNPSPPRITYMLSLTPHYVVMSVIHARMGSAAPPQKKGDSQQLDATAPGPEHQHQRSRHLRSQLQRQHHQYRDQHRPTSDHRAADRKNDVVQVARQAQVQTREVEAVVVAVAAAAAAVVEAAVETVEIAVVKVVIEIAVTVEQLQVPMETHR